MREMFEFLKLLNKPFYVLSGSSYLKNSGIMEHPLYKGAISIEKKNDVFKFTLDEIKDEKFGLVCMYKPKFVYYILGNIGNIFEKLYYLIFFKFDSHTLSEKSFLFLSKKEISDLLYLLT